MARTRRDASITTKNARRQLRPRRKPYCRSLGPGVAIGYVRRERGAGAWVAVEYLGDANYRQAQLGVADDVLEADGASVLNFDQAKAAAIRQVEGKRADDRASAHGPVQTVRSAVMAYVAMQDQREIAEQRVKGNARRRTAGHVLNDLLADIPLHALTEDDLAEWIKRRPPELVHTGVRRIVSDVRAALNLAGRQYRKQLPPDFVVVVRNGLANSVADSAVPIARDGQALPDSDIRRILDAARAIDAEEGLWHGDLYRMVAVLAATGTRVSQAMRLRVADVQFGQSRLMLPVSRKGKGGKLTTHVGTRVGSDILELLRPAVAGRRGDEVLLERWRHKRVTGVPPRFMQIARGPWTDAAEIQRPWRRIVARAGLSADVTCYHLRHSSIVRQLRANLPARVVAELHDTSVLMIERHYGRAIASALDDIVARAIVPLLPDEDDRRVVPLRIVQGGSANQPG